MNHKTLCRPILRTVNIFQNWATFATSYRFAGHKAINDKKFMETPWQFIKNATKLRIPQQKHSYITHFSLQNQS
jgi:hypothetical protein